MESEAHAGYSSGRVRQKIGALGVALAIIGLCTGKSIAGDLLAQPTGGLNVTGAAATAALPQGPAAGAPPEPTAGATGGPSAELGFLSGLHVSGFLSQTFGMWQNPSALREYTTSRNNLAVSRTWLQVDENLRLGDSNNLFMREWFVYEPPYAFNSANGFGKYSNEFYNQYTVRDAWWENKTGPLSTYIGNQIVVWGQSLAFRVGDVVNPQDTTWAFGFANLEQSRIPQWMIHSIYNLPQFGPLTSNFVEGILLPRLQPMWNSCDYADHRYDRECNVNAGSVNNGFPAGVGFDPTGRFGAHLSNSGPFYPGRTAVSPGSGGIFPPYGQPVQNARLIGAPLDNEFFYCTNLGSAAQRFNPVPKALQHPCAFLGNKTAVDVGQWKVPASTVANWEEGIRFHTLIGGAEMTAFYFNAWNLYPNTFWEQYTNQFRARFNPMQKVGFTADMPIPMPSSVSEFLPVVGRAEAVYTNHESVLSFDPVAHPNGVRYTDMLSWMVALDIDQAYAPWLTSTGNLSANVEVYDELALDSSGSMFETFGPWTGGGIENTTNIKNNVSALFNIGTGWLWEDVEPTWTMVFNPKGRAFLLFPSLVLNPPWTKKYFMKLQAIEVLGGDKSTSQAGGILKGQSLLTAQFQYNFNLL
jgi:uncharacterized protein DUF1302